MQPTQYQIDRLYRRIMMTVAPVQIKATNDDNAIHQAQIAVHGTPELIDDVGVQMFYGYHAHPLPNTDATAVFIAGDRSKPIVVGHGHQQYRPRKWQPGEVGLYTDEGDGLKFSRQNNFSVTTKVANVSGSTSITLTSPNVSTTHKTTLGQDPASNMEAATKQYVDKGDGAVADRVAALEARIAELEARLA